MLPYEPMLYEGGVWRVKHPSTKDKTYQAMISYRSVIIVHPRKHRTKQRALEQAERMCEKLLSLEKENDDNISESVEEL